MPMFSQSNAIEMIILAFQFANVIYQNFGRQLSFILKITQWNFENFYRSFSFIRIGKNFISFCFFQMNKLWDMENIDFSSFLFSSFLKKAKWSKAKKKKLFKIIWEIFFLEKLNYFKVYAINDGIRKIRRWNKRFWNEFRFFVNNILFIFWIKSKFFWKRFWFFWKKVA